VIGWSMGVDIHGDCSGMRDWKSKTKHIIVVVGLFAQELSRAK